VKRFGFFLWIWLALVGCTEKDQWSKQANQSLLNRERGLNEKNLKLYLSAVSSQYGGDPTGFTRIQARAEALFGSIDEISYTSSERSLYREDDGRVRVIQRFAMDLKRAGKTKSLSGQEQLYLIQDRDGNFRIVDGL
jgi:hypothetical protein